jgi:hypothetical protein
MLLPRTLGCVVCIYKGEAAPGSCTPDQVFIIPGKHELFCTRHKPDDAVPYCDYLRRW